jgi:hypothetical protein
LLARFDEAVGVGDLVENESAGDCGAQRAVGNALADKAFKRRQLRVVAFAGWEGEARIVRSRARMSNGGTTVGSVASAP